MIRKLTHLMMTIAAMFAAALSVAAQGSGGIVDPAGSLALETPVADIAVTPDGRFVYVIEEGTGMLLGYGFDRMSGELSPLEGFPMDIAGMSFQPTALVIVQSGTTMYVANNGFIGRSLLTPVTVLGINPETGAVTMQDNFGIPSESGVLNAISADSSGQLITVTDAGSNTIQVFRYTRPAIMPPADVQTQTIALAPYRNFCTGVGPQLCYLATIDGEEQFFYNEIEGFEYIWGTTYELRVRVEPVANPPADASSLRYILEEVISAEPVGPDFTFQLSLPPVTITNNNDGTFTILGEQTFTCEEAMCTEIAALLQGTDNIDLVVRFPEAAGEPLQARLQIER